MHVALMPHDLLQDGGGAGHAGARLSELRVPWVRHLSQVASSSTGQVSCTS
jgi:hypothetical protein